MNTNPPETKYHQRKQGGVINSFHEVVYGRKSIMLRGRRWIGKLHLFDDPPLKAFMFRHSQRSHHAPYYFSFLFFFVVGNIGHYINYKKNVVEDKWVEKYGQDVPSMRKFWLTHWVQRVRAE